MQRIGPELKVRLKQEIEVNVSECFLIEEDHHPQLLSLKRNTMRKFICFQARKYVSSGSALKHWGGNGRKKIPRRTDSRIKRLLVKMPGSSPMNVAPKVGVSAQTVSNVMIRNGYKSYHRWRTQKLSDTHKLNHLRSVKALLQKYGKYYREMGAPVPYDWPIFVNELFTGYIPKPKTVSSGCTQTRHD